MPPHAGEQLWGVAGGHRSPLLCCLYMLNAIKSPTLAESVC